MLKVNTREEMSKLCNDGKCHQLSRTFDINSATIVYSDQRSIFIELKERML